MCYFPYRGLTKPTVSAARAWKITTSIPTKLGVTMRLFDTVLRKILLLLNSQGKELFLNDKCVYIFKRDCDFSGSQNTVMLYSLR